MMNEEQTKDFVLECLYKAGEKGLSEIAIEALIENKDESDTLLGLNDSIIQGHVLVFKNSNTGNLEYSLSDQGKEIAKQLLKDQDSATSKL